MYDFKNVEKKWQEYWLKNETFKTDVWDFSKPKYYVLDMFPYPSGQGLHAGHVEGYTATDIVARFKRMQGYNVLHPMGWDAFGLPAEQYAITTGNHPDGFTDRNIETMKKQLNMLGFSYDWDKEISTSDPKYYKWTQWIFMQLFKDGLVKYIDMPVNWCEALGTVLANDEVIDGKSERGGHPVVRKNLKQWVIDIPAYAEKLLEGLEQIDWPESTKEMQRNWIGKSVGAEIEFKVNDTNLSFTVFTTRPDTLFGSTYCVLAPEHILVSKITTEDQKEEVNKYLKNIESKSDLERTELNKEKTGVFTGAYAINPVNNKKLPIYIADYVLVTYGTGAIMSVPAHDDRDYEFAKKYNLEIIPVVEGGDVTKEAYLGDGKHINSDFLNGLNKEDAINKMIAWLEENKVGRAKTTYRLRDWIFSRQRYWGEPMPIVHTDEGYDIISEEDLPLVLPKLKDYAPDKDGNAPLAKATEWVNVEFNGKPAKRETSTMPGSAGSSWYFLRYIDPHNDEKIADPKLLKHWLPVDLYLGGSEHAVGHLLYSRMWNNYLYDKGISPVKEPFKKLVHQGMILGSNGEKMSKSRGNVVNPDDIVNSHGSDTLRLYEMFMGPIEADKPWSETGIDGAKRFLERVYRLFTEENKISEQNNPDLDRVYHYTVKKVTHDYENLAFNTAISQMMVFINEAYKTNVLPKDYAEGFLKLLNPIAPHITEELWSFLGHTETIAYEAWPTFDETKLKTSTYEMIVQVNGKLRGKAEVSVDATEEEMKKIALDIPNVISHTRDKEIIKIITISGKMVNIVVK